MRLVWHKKTRWHSLQRSSQAAGNETLRGSALHQNSFRLQRLLNILYQYKGDEHVPIIFLQAAMLQFMQRIMSRYELAKRLKKLKYKFRKIIPI